MLCFYACSPLYQLLHTPEYPYVNVWPVYSLSHIST